MKIEIEYEEVELLKSRINRQESEIAELRTELSKLSKTEIENNIVNLADVMFRAYVTGIFKKLGFDGGDVQFEDNLRHWIGKSWYDSDKLKVTIGATVTNRFKAAFLSLGVITTEKTDTQ